ncbi:glutamate carboxypeptidase [Azorhizobium sp. AG788]|uniref:M20 family metallopeptidase n=1 Tax=Azorhizobium sp. AG788 TaxID=2183897 RepID=UPI00105D44D0|nr:M20 family metallopeptidase [Azorhizobium sp. AG788]TDT87720.1 glutamate carboxypeptidase [Azorhizobium sp. AG788]
MSTLPTPTGLDAALAEKVVAWLAPRFDEMEALLKRLVNMESSSFDKEGTDKVGEVIAEILTAEGILVTRLPQQGYGDVFRAEVHGRAGGAHALLLGHRDTVFAKGTVANRPYSRKDKLAFGPGVCDMKAGLVTNIFTLRAIKAVGGLSFPVVALFTGDEEIGSGTGRPEIERAAHGARAVLNTEPGRVSGNVVTGRKGGGSFLIKVTGKAAHSGVNHKDGASAIETLARKIVKLHALTDYEAGITTNVGVIKGGNTHNTVAPWAEAELDLRFVTLDQHKAVTAEIERIVAEPEVPGTSATVAPKSMFLPLEERHSAGLFALYRDAAAKDVGFEVGGEFTGGCADSGFTASLGVPTLCGLGPIGGKAHTDDEFCELDSLVPRTQALAATLCRLA